MFFSINNYVMKLIDKGCGNISSLDQITIDALRDNGFPFYKRRKKDCEFLLILKLKEFQD